MPSFASKLFTRSTSSSSAEKVVSPPSYLDEESLPNYTPPARRRVVLEAEDPMVVYARMRKGHAMGGVRHAATGKKVKT
jgi:hypothetical protein